MRIWAPGDRTTVGVRAQATAAGCSLPLFSVFMGSSFWEKKEGRRQPLSHPDAASS
uniref:Uncharacterized protein n=1 Tax=Arundo donax TaxID=35708 RepID=A0A0A9CHC2_ARUDO